MSEIVPVVQAPSATARVVTRALIVRRICELLSVVGRVTIEAPDQVPIFLFFS
jgi:hypothetical protein